MGHSNFYAHAVSQDLFIKKSLKITIEPLNNWIFGYSEKAT